PNNKVILPWLANNPGKLKKIKAREMKKKETIENFDSVMFVIPSGNFFVQLNAKKNGNGTYEIDIPGLEDVDHSTPIFAIARNKDATSFFDAGKMMQANYKERTHKLNIVSLVGKLDDSYKTEAEKVLNSIYGRVGVTYEVTLSVFDNDSIKKILNDGLAIGADKESRWKVETKEMRAIRALYSDSVAIDRKAAYLFVVNHPQEEEYRRSVDGDMPRNQSVGYLFKDNINTKDLGRLIAHELGHGVYKFQHVFDYNGIEEKTTDNIMDYKDGDYLAHFQWKIMQDSVMFVWKALQDDEEGMDKDNNKKKSMMKCLAKQSILAIYEKYEGELLTKTFTAQDIADMIPAIWSKVSSNCEFDPTFLKIVEVLTDVVNCYISSNSEEELNYCICNTVMNDVLFEYIQDFFDAAKEALHEITDSIDAGPLVQPFIKEGIKKIEEWVDTQVAKFEEFLKNNICGDVPPITSSGRYEKDFFDIYIECKNDYVIFDIDIVTARENPLQSVRIYTGTEEGGMPPSDYVNTLYVCEEGEGDNYTYAPSALRESEYYKNIPKRCDKAGKTGQLFLNMYSFYTWNSILGGFDWEDRDGLGPEEDGRFHYYYKIKMPYPKNSTVLISVNANLYEGDWPRFPKIDGALNTIADLFNYVRGINPNDERYQSVYPITRQKQKIATCGIAKPTEEQQTPSRPVICSDECTKAGYDDKYTKNPFGTASTVEAATKKRREGEEKYGIPKCSGWKTESNGTKYISPLTCGESSRVEKLYSIAKNSDVAVMNMSVAKENLYKTFHYWDGTDSMLIEDSNNKIKMINVDDFVEMYLSNGKYMSFMMDIYTRMNFVLMSNTFIDNPAFDRQDYISNQMSQILSMSPGDDNNLCGMIKKQLKETYGTRHQRVRRKSGEYNAKLSEFYSQCIAGYPSIKSEINSMDLKCDITEEQIKTALKNCGFLTLLKNFVHIMCNTEYPLRFIYAKDKTPNLYNDASEKIVMDKGYNPPAYPIDKYYGGKGKQFCFNKQADNNAGIDMEYYYNLSASSTSGDPNDYFINCAKLFNDWDYLTNLNSVFLNRLQMFVCYENNIYNGMNARPIGTVFRCDRGIPHLWEDAIDNLTR
nr:hypothetical protein [Paludibacteraceae bacterium]